MDLPDLTLVIGGAASGKSKFAEGLVRSQSDRRIYLATAQAWDTEMHTKVEAHRASREKDNWQTIEAPLDLAPVFADFRQGDVVLLDCATMWLSNLMHHDREWKVETETLLAALSASVTRVVIVSNEIGQGIVPDNALARKFRQAQGELNQKLAAEAGLVVTVIAGLPMVLKGRLP